MTIFRQKSKSIIILCFLCLNISPAVAETNWYAEGLKAEFAGDVVTAIEHYKKSANKGLSDASYALSRLYASKNEDETSFKWLLKSANARNQFAQYDLASLYLHGNQFVEANINEATKWFQSAAIIGHGEAAFELFKLNGDVKWLIYASEKGVKGAMETLIIAYEKSQYGLGDNKSQQQKWEKRLADSSEQGEQQ
jgi:uncharacterized protein